MKVSGSSAVCYAPSSALAPRAEAAATDFMSLLAETQTPGAPPGDKATAVAAPTPPDFTSMTRQQLRDWVNDEIRHGRMSLEDGGVFIGMTIRIPVDGQDDDCPNDPTRFNYLEITRSGIEGALWQHDRNGAERLRTALAQMKDAQASEFA